VTSPAPACTPDQVTPLDDVAEGADRWYGLGSRVLYVPLNPNPRAYFSYNNNPAFQTNVFDTTLQPDDRYANIAQSPPYYNLFRKGFDTFVLWVGPSVPICVQSGCDLANHPEQCVVTACTPSLVNTPQELSHLFSVFAANGGLVQPYRAAPILDGMTPDEITWERNGIKKLASYVLSNPNDAFTGKTFVFANQEGDWELRWDHYGDESYEPCSTAVTTCTGPEPTREQRVANMRTWLQARQDGVNDARQAYPSSPVRVLLAAEFNKVQWAMEATPTSSRMTLTNDVLPTLPNCCDAYSYSFWDAGDPKTPDQLIARLDYFKTKVHDTQPFGHSNVILTEYGSSLDPFGGDPNLHAETMRRLTEAAIAWGCPMTAYWQLYDGLVRSMDATQRPTNADTDATGIIRPDGTQTPLYGMFQNFMSRSMLRAGLSTYYGYYVSADDGGGGAVHVNAPWLRQWEEFTIIDRNGGDLMSGDSVNILTHNGHYLMAQDNGGGAVYASSTHDLAWERFTILKQNGTAPIRAGDIIALQAGDGHYFVAEGGGGGQNVLNANRDTIGAWEQFVLTDIPAMCSYTASPTQQAVSSGGGNYSVAVTTAAGCGWTVTNNASWLTVTSATNGCGNATISYTVAANTGNTRSATLTVVAGQVVTITQAGICTSFSVTPTSLNISAGGGSPTITVTGLPSGCQGGAWSASANAAWVTVSPTSGSGSGSVTLTVAQNTAGARSASATIAGQNIPIAQAGTSAPSPPTNVQATTQGTMAVQVAWLPSASAGVTGYYVWCSVDGAAFQQVTPNPVQSPWPHSSLQPNVAYRYKVVAWDGASTSGDSNIDLAATVVFDDVTIVAYQTTIRAIHIIQLRAAIDVVRHAKGWPAATYTDPSLCQTLTAQHQCIGGITIRKQHVQELRDRLIEVLPLLNVSTPVFTDDPLTAGTLIKKVHIDQLRAAVQ
jgi:hypothetical protein